MFVIESLSCGCLTVGSFSDLIRTASSSEIGILKGEKYYLQLRSTELHKFITSLKPFPFFVQTNASERKLSEQVLLRNMTAIKEHSFFVCLFFGFLSFSLITSLLLGYKLGKIKTEHLCDGPCYYSSTPAYG